jgi:predicted DNA-binding protein
MGQLNQPIPDDLHQDLNVLSAHTGKKQKELVNEMLEEGIEKRKNQLDLN